MEKAYQKTTEEIYKELETSEKGLTNDEAKKDFGHMVKIFLLKNQKN